ncbi:MAG: hypothetical protein CL944_01845 [Candidatus Diapherotrites archaeon]|uniref:Right handed beta helix domain-containing protein n=1 Tax=Candidatus Iainarchaeum sp. TaxID=3101447 RepID=A0A2D6LPS3_9ARCH|nr:hypothetical protein [Candidatus Diapherotrites archaeon]|tara:strand:+ start:1427 stop:3544 length:2118 start_codon:yes stop_codon:yes gene_type:complete
MIYNKIKLLLIFLLLISFSITVNAATLECPDFNDDLEVDLFDLVYVASRIINGTGHGADLSADINDDLAIDISDLIVVASNFKTCEPVVTQTYQCSDGEDNDSDGLTDFGSDPGCASETDNDETDETGTVVVAQVNECNNDLDDDGDGLTDFDDNGGSAGVDLGCFGPNGQETNTNYGWTLFEPGPNTEIYYVSDTDGDDLECTGLSPTPYDPVGNPTNCPKKTIVKGREALRGTTQNWDLTLPHWLLLKRGDTFETPTIYKPANGVSASEIMLISSYGNSTERPVIKTGNEVGIRLISDSTRNIAVVGLEFYAHTRDPSNPNFSTAGQKGIGQYGTGDNLLFEDNYFHFYANNSFEKNPAQPPMTNLTFRRNIIANNYESGGSSQGIFANTVDGILLEENLLVHNGWNDDAGKPANQFNHNTYFSSVNDITIRNNMFLQASSIGNKFRSDVTGASENITIENNLYAEGSVGISIGGNTNERFRFKNVTITDNVLTDIGRTNPEGRNFGWGIDLQDHDTALVSNNYIIHQIWGNSFAINMGGDSQKDSVVENNLVYDFYTGTSERGLFRIAADPDWINATIRNNNLQNTTGSSVIRFLGDFTKTTFSGNNYFSIADPSAWFLIQDVGSSYSDWLTASGETDSTTNETIFTDPTRNIDLYHGSLGKTATLEAFITEAKKQSKFNWKEEYTADAVNTWIRAGFTPAQ